VKSQNKWSKNWKSSKQVRKQRKYRYNAPLHVKHGFVSVHLSKELRDKHKRRALPARKGDKVKILRGSFKGKSGKIENINSKQEKVYVEGIMALKRDGTKVPKALKPSNLMILELNLDDKMRQKIIKRKIE